jgi:signal transduction histidine kinase
VLCRQLSKCPSIAPGLDTTGRSPVYSTIGSTQGGLSIPCHVLDIEYNMLNFIYNQPHERKTKPMNQAEKESQPVNYKDYSILIVDDLPVNLGVVVDYLESYGFGIRIARSGDTAIKRVRYDPPDLILLDILMPGMDGFETCRKLKAIKAAKDIPIIFMTSLTDVEDKVKGFEAGAVDYVTKPLNQEEVLARVKTHLRMRDLTLSLREKNKLLETSGQVERDRLFAAISQQREQLRALNQKLNEVQEAERKQLARELHDEMGQALTAISINLAAMAQDLPPNYAKSLSERLKESQMLADQTLEQIRELSFNLRPAMLDDLGLAPTLRWYLKRYQKRVGITVDLEASSLKERLPVDIETALYRIFQEALTNITRHARASHVELIIRRSKDGVLVEIKDDGCGFEMEQVFGSEASTSGMGLLGMRERTVLLGGIFNLHSAPGAGTQVSIEIPLEAAS